MVINARSLFLYAKLYLKQVSLNEILQLIYLSLTEICLLSHFERELYEIPLMQRGILRRCCLKSLVLHRNVTFLDILYHTY